jgi:hypothetical protein
MAKCTARGSDVLMLIVIMCFIPDRKMLSVTLSRWSGRRLLCQGLLREPRKFYGK